MERTPDTETVVLIQDLDDKNEKAYEVLEKSYGKPGRDTSQKKRRRVAKVMKSGQMTGQQVFQVVKWLKENDGKRLYKENQAYILKILAFQEK